MRDLAARCLASGLYWLEAGLLVALFTAMALLAFAQIGIRNCPDLTWLPFIDIDRCRAWQPLLSWGDPATRLLVLWIALVGAMLAARDNRHIRIDLLQRLMPPRVRRVTDTLANLAAAGLCAVVAWFSAQFVALEYAEGYPAFASLPGWLAESIIPVAFAVIATRLARQALATVRANTR